MKKLSLFTLACCSLVSMGFAQYSLTVEASPAILPGLGTTYQFFVNLENETDFLSAVYGNSQTDFIINVPDGAYNSPSNTWNAAGLMPDIIGFFPEYTADTYATIGLEIPASLSVIDNPCDPGLAEDPQQPISPFFIVSGATSVSNNSMVGASWYVLPNCGNGYAQYSDLRVLIMQVTTTGTISGQINYQVFPLGDGADAARFTVDFDGAGTFESELFVEVLGCMDETACNYNPEANLEPIGTCDFGNPEDYDECGICNGPGAVYDCGCFDIPEGGCDCNGDVIDDCGVCGGNNTKCYGCTDVNACNYNPTVGFDDGSCESESCAGCTHADACNYDGTATIDDGTCESESCAGCTDAMACNYDETATIDDMSCGPVVGSACDDGDETTINDVIGEDCLCAGVAIVEGCTDEAACNYNADANTDDGSCEVDMDADGICDDEDPCVGQFDECGVCNGPGAIYECGCGDIPIGDCDCDGNVVDALGVCGGTCTVDSDGDGVCDDQEIYGCRYELAENYNPDATRDDDSCIFPCEGAVNINLFDWDEDYAVTVTDFLMMLSVYGDVDVDFDGVWDSGDLCVDTEACNYDVEPSEECVYIDVLGICGGGCEADEDNDGICDDVDTCVGIEDECGVCNGPGPTEVVIESITILYDSVYLPQLDEWYVYEFGADTTFTYTCAPSFSVCGDPLSYQGYDYATVLIGEQCWFAENLRSENYENGDAIPSNLNGYEWGTTNVGASAVYGEGDGPCFFNNSPDGDACQENWALTQYGRLYNWFATVDPRGLCPPDWHVSSTTDWNEIEQYLGVDSAGFFMKSTNGWMENGNGINTSGFFGLPGGLRQPYSPDENEYFTGFGGAGTDGYWWANSPSSNDKATRGLLFQSVDIWGPYSSFTGRDGKSVRCVRDAE